MNQCNPIAIFLQMHKELDCEVGKNAVDISLDLRTKCPYIEATIMEIQRFSSIAPVAIMHAATADCEYRGYNIPKHTEVRFKQKSASLESNSKLHPRLQIRGVLPGDSFRHRYTPGNPFAYPGINKAHPSCCLRGKCSFRLIQSVFMYWRAFAVGSRHISVRFYVCETTRCGSAALRLRAN